MDNQMKDIKWELTHETFIKEKIEQYERWFNQLVEKIHELDSDIVVIHSALIELKDGMDILSKKQTTIPEFVQPKAENVIDTSNALDKIRARLTRLKEEPPPQPAPQKEVKKGLLKTIFENIKWK